MSKVVALMSMSLDGYVADPDDGVAEVFAWYFNSGDVEFHTGRASTWISSSKPAFSNCWMVSAPWTPTFFPPAAALAWRTALSMPSVTKWTVESGRGHPSGIWVVALLLAGLSKHVDLRLVSRLELGSGAVALRYEPIRNQPQ